MATTCMTIETLPLCVNWLAFVGDENAQEFEILRDGDPWDVSSDEVTATATGAVGVVLLDPARPGWLSISWPDITAAIVDGHWELQVDSSEHGLVTVCAGTFEARDSL